MSQSFSSSDSVGPPSSPLSRVQDATHAINALADEMVSELWGTVLEETEWTQKCWECCSVRIICMHPRFQRLNYTLKSPS